MVVVQVVAGRYSNRCVARSPEFSLVRGSAVQGFAGRLARPLEMGFQDWQPAFSTHAFDSEGYSSCRCVL